MRVTSENYLHVLPEIFALQFAGVGLKLWCTGLQSIWTTQTEVRYRGHDLDLLGSRDVIDVIGRVTIQLAMCGFLLVVYLNQTSILHG